MLIRATDGILLTSFVLAPMIEGVSAAVVKRVLAEPAFDITSCLGGSWSLALVGGCSFAIFLLPFLADILLSSLLSREFRIFGSSFFD